MTSALADAFAGGSGVSDFAAVLADAALDEAMLIEFVVRGTRIESRFSFVKEDIGRLRSCIGSLYGQPSFPLCLAVAQIDLSPVRNLAEDRVDVVKDVLTLLDLERAGITLQHVAAVAGSHPSAARTHGARSRRGSAYAFGPTVPSPRGSIHPAALRPCGEHPVPGRRSPPFASRRLAASSPPKR